MITIFGGKVGFKYILIGHRAFWVLVKIVKKPGVIVKISIFGDKVGVFFLENQCEEPLFTKTDSILCKKLPILSHHWSKIVLQIITLAPGQLLIISSVVFSLKIPHSSNPCCRRFSQWASAAKGCQMVYFSYQISQFV
jgi:hypothetical protein